jgi:outer membrane protein OmpA-like peptidoglycan-associated protein
MTTRRRRLATILTAAAALWVFGLVLISNAGEARAQATTFSLDRLRIGGAPDDGVAVWRPEMGEKTRFFGQLDLGFSYNAFRIANHIQKSAQDRARLAGISGAPVRTQFTGYADIGVELFSRLSFQVMFPLTFVQTGNPTSSTSVASAQDSVNLAHTAPGDLRFDLRGVVVRSNDRKFKLGANVFLLAPTGLEKSFTGDKSASGGLGLAGEIDLKKVFFVLDTGFHFRPLSGVNDFKVQHEWTWGFGAFLPLRDNRVRLGLELFGSTGLGGDTTFHDANTPLEWMAEARFAVDQKKRLYVGGNGGTRLTPGYAPDFRLGALIGYSFPISDENPKAPPKKFKAITNGSVDTDHDGYPDDIDLCPTEPEDGKPPFATDGCPAPPDRDGDGIPDAKDKCPDVPEDKDGVDDWDGCPEDDADKDGIPDAQDKCPKEPGQVNTKDPSKNGCPQFIRRISGSDEIQILQQVQFDTGKATIKPGSFPILDEVWKLLEANPEITLLAIEGHTDNRGGDELNLRLSKDRAHSCLDYLVKKGIAASRLSSDGFGKNRPLDTNDTDEGRQKNRRVEFHIRQQSGGTPANEEPAQPGASGPKKPAPTEPAPGND